MKKKLFLTAILMAFVGALNAQNLILNADFEIVANNVFESWSTSTPNEVRLQGANPDPLTTRTVNGTNCVRLSAAFNYSELKQTVTVEPGETYDISFRGRISDGAGMEGATNTGRVLYCEILDDVGTKLADIGNVPTSTNTTVTAQYTVPAGITSITIILYKAPQADTIAGIAYFDDVSITKGTLGIDDLKQFSFRTYPNPVKDHINLSAAKNINKVEIYSLLGQQVKNITLNSNTARVNVSGLSKGVYLVKTFIEDAVGTYKFVKE